MVKASEKSFTEHTQALSEILDRFRQESLSLETSMLLFEEGVLHIQQSQAFLNQAKGRFQSIQDALEEAT
ncbi:MAG: exodeoxyribonuclease VII small subunit [Vampirovibrio sp.]